MTVPQELTGNVTFEKLFGNPNQNEPIEENLEVILGKTFPFSLLNLQEIIKCIAPENLERVFQFTKVSKGQILDKQNSYILIQGSILISSIGERLKKGIKEHSLKKPLDPGKEESTNVIETITEFTYFGYEFRLLAQEIYKYEANKESSLLEIQPEHFDKLFWNNRTFQISICQSIFHKCKILKPILRLQRFIQASVRENHELDLEKLKSHYLKLKSRKHSLCNDQNIDYSALEYAL